MQSLGAASSRVMGLSSLLQVGATGGRTVAPPALGLAVAATATVTPASACKTKGAALTAYAHNQCQYLEDSFTSRMWTLKMQQARYSKEVHEHFFKPRNAGAFDISDPDMEKKVGTAIVGKAACGDVIKLQVMVEDGKIKDARFKTFGCGSAIASSSYATEMIKGRTCDDAMKLKNTDIAEYLNLPPVKVHCSLLAEDAVRHAILDYKKKQGNDTALKSNSSVMSEQTATAESAGASRAVADALAREGQVAREASARAAQQ